MPDVKWIKLATDIFDNRKIRQIEAMPEGDSIIVIWIKLLCLAGNVNDNGFVYLTKEIPFTDQMLATEFNRPLLTVQLALKTFLQFGMIEIIDNVLFLSGWEKYQNTAGLDRIREQTRKRVANYRERKALLEASKTADVTLHVTQCNAAEEEIEKEIEIDIEEELEIPVAAAEKTNYKQILSLYNELCPSFPQIRALSDARKTAIRARLRQYSMEDFGTVFMKAEASDFLKGRNARNWSATFDWLINGNNFAKVLDGNYDNKDAQTKVKTEVQTPENYDADLEAWLNSQK